MISHDSWETGGRLNIKMASYQYRNPQTGPCCWRGNGQGDIMNLFQYKDSLFSYRESQYMRYNIYDVNNFTRKTTSLHIYIYISIWGPFYKQPTICCKNYVIWICVNFCKHLIINFHKNFDTKHEYFVKWIPDATFYKQPSICCKNYVIWICVNFCKHLIINFHKNFDTKHKYFVKWIPDATLTVHCGFITMPCLWAGNGEQRFRIRTVI